VAAVFLIALAGRCLVASLAMNESIRRSSLLTRRRDTPYLLASCSTVGIGAVSIVRRVCPMASDYRHERASVNVQRYRELRARVTEALARERKQSAKKGTTPRRRTARRS